MATGAGGSCARARLATDLDGDGKPQWIEVGARECFTTPLGAQGLLAIGGDSPGAALFSGTRLRLDDTVTSPDLRTSPAAEG